MKKYIRVLTIAGSDSGGGAGIQADLKTFTAFGCYGMSAITALTAQNTLGVKAIHAIPADFVKLQIEAVVADIGVDAIKIGVLQNTEIIYAVTTALKKINSTPIVIDPVMVAKGGSKLLEDTAIDELQKKLLPLATIITPNIPEAEFLLNKKISSRDEMELAVKQLSKTGAQAVLLKGGHLPTANSPDCFYIKSSDTLHWLEGERIATKNTHGTGCTLSAAITACLAKKHSLLDAVKEGKKYLTRALKAAAEYQIGHGHGPVGSPVCLHH